MENVAIKLAFNRLCLTVIDHNLDYEETRLEFTQLYSTYFDNPADSDSDFTPYYSTGSKIVVDTDCFNN